MTFERVLSPECTMRIALRARQTLGDPLGVFNQRYLYLLIILDPGLGPLDSVSLVGFPKQRAAPGFAARERWLWAAGKDWNLSDGQEERKADVAAESPGGVFWYNKGSDGTGGMMAAFLPEEVSSCAATDGPAGVEVRLGLKKPTARLALWEWGNRGGGRRARKNFMQSLPVRVKKLREMSFAWPADSLMLSDFDQEVVRALLQSNSAAAAKQGGEGGLAQKRKRLSGTWQTYQQALNALREVPLADSRERYRKEREVAVLRSEVAELMKPLLREWVNQGGPQ